MLPNSNTESQNTPPPVSPFKIAAGEIALKRGIPVIPIPPREKGCKLPNWPALATTDKEQLTHWLNENPDYNAGAVAKPDGIWILDCDDPALPERIEAETGKRIAPTLTVKSSKGVHFYFKQTDSSRAMGNRKKAGGFDAQVSDKYVVAPGSIHPSGAVYQIVDDSEIVDAPQWLIDWVIANSDTPKARSGNGERSVHEDFDFGAFCDHYELEILSEGKGDKHVLRRCPVKGDHHTSDGKPDYGATCVFYDGEMLGFSCLATSCKGCGMSMGQLVHWLHTDGGFAPYPGPIWEEEPIEDVMEAFGTEDAQDQDENSEPQAPAAQVSGKAAAPSEARGGDSVLPKRPKLNAKQKAIMERMRKRNEPCEENWGGICKGGCGQYITGQFTCNDCKAKQQEKGLALKEGEVELYRANIGKPEDKLLRQVVAIEAASVRPEPMTWLWDQRIPEGAITWVVGQPGNAKSLFTIEVVACATTGRDYPDGAKNTTGPVKVLMFCGEDDLKKTVVPRLLAAGADLKNIRFLDSRSFRGMVGDNIERGRAIDLDQDMETLLGLLKANPEIKLMIADPITGIFGVKQITKDQEVNPILEELVDLCKETGLVFLGVCHTPKRQTNSATEKIAGGSSVAGKCRAAFMLSRDPDAAPNEHHAHVMTMIKGNLTGNKSGLKYQTVEHTLDVEDQEIKIAKIVWGESTNDIADDVLMKQNSKTVERDRQADKCEAFLFTFLADGPRRSPEVYEAAKAQGFGSTTVKRALKNVGGHHNDRRPQGQGFWMSLDPNPVFDQAAEIKQPSMSLAAGEAL